jgi:hypothetical protein
MAKIITKNSFTSGSAPSGLSAGEIAVNVADKKIFVGNAVGGVVTLHDQNAVVTSVNGATGAVTNINAATSTITNTNSISTFYPAFVGGSGNTGLFIDAVTTPLSYVPSTGTLNGRIFNGTSGLNTVKLDALLGYVYASDSTDINIFNAKSFVHSGPSSLIFLSQSPSPGHLFLGNVRFSDGDPDEEYGTETWGYTFPAAQGTSGQAMFTNGSGQLYWGNTVKTDTAQTFTQLQTFSAGISGSGATFTGDIAVNGGDITTSSSTATIFNNTATSISVGGAASSTINIGATDGTSTIDLNSNLLKEVELRNYFETKGTPTYVGGMTQTLTVDLSTANVFVYTTTGTISQINITNIPSKANIAVGFTLVITCGDSLYGVEFDVLGTGVPVWAGGTPPTFTSTVGRTDIVSYVTYDGGTTWYGMVGGLNFS